MTATTEKLGLFLPQNGEPTCIHMAHGTRICKVR